ncbi:MAG: hypothetical protein OQK82_00635 [Candidatus Pacearchaeota archaeon]|nr:hypothetical protein [Candidatus Pacearchaeota archaeon]
MKKIPLTPILFFFLIGFTSATIVSNAQIENIYNLGDTINVPIKITSTTNLINVKASMKLLCNGIETEVYSEYFKLEAGEEKSREPSIPLIQDLLGRSTATCKIKLSLGEEDPILSDEFSISNKISITPKLSKSEFSPGETIIIEGDAIKENGKSANGFVEIIANVANTSSSIKTTDTVKSGYFYIEIPLEENTKAGSYSVSINVYEVDSSGEKTNLGYSSATFTIIQIPTSLEIAFEEKEIEPGTNIKVKTILHDQTGEKINSASIVTIKNQNQDILEQKELKTEEYLEYEIPYNQNPSNWTIVAISNKLNAQAEFKILEKKDVKIELNNETLMITNVGNILYNDSILVKIGNKSLNLNITLKVDESKEFKLTAPNGEYKVSVMANGKDTFTQSLTLTGRSISVKQATGSVTNIIKYPIAWFFIIGIFGFIGYIFFKKGYKKSLFGSIKKKQTSKLEEHSKKFNSLINFKKTKEKKLLENISNKAELSLSIKGTKQTANLICLKIKNFDKIEISTIKDTMQKIIDLTQKSRIMIYENQDNLFFLFAPAKTKTFQNEKQTIELAQELQKILTHHNKLFKQQIDYGISINTGSIIAKMKHNILEFMGLEGIINSAKKIASNSNQEILLDETTKNKLATIAKTTKKELGNLSAYKIDEIKEVKNHKKFLDSFIKRMNEEKK